MVKVKYYPHAVNGEAYVYTVNCLADFLRQPQFDREDLVNMQFYHGDILGNPVDTEDGSFINITDGEITVVDGRTFPGDPVSVAVAVVVSVAVAAITVLLMPKPAIPDAAKGNRKQPSSTNALSDTSNKPRINQRIDDIFGSVNKHTPPLWQAPYRVGVNDQETEVLLTCVGRGKYDIDTNRIYDGDTRYRDIPGAQVNIYEPGTHPGNGSPTQTLGGLIDDPIGIYRESNDLNPTELLPPNELFFGAGARFKASKSGTDTVFTVTNVSGDLRDKFSVGGTLVLEEAYLSESTGTFRLYRDTGGDVIIRDFVTQNLINVSGAYDITAVTSDTVTVSGISETFPDNSPLVLDYIEVADVDTGTSLFFTYDINIETGVWYQNYNANPDPELGEVMFSDPVEHFNLNKRPDVGETSNNFVGPITIPQGSSRILINLTSNSGFYKLDEGTEVSINADVSIEVEELRENGEPTGVGFTIPVTYNSNASNTRFSVYRSYYIDIPYDNARVSCKRNTNRDKSDSVSNVDKIEWTLLYGFEPLSSSIEFGDVTLMHTLIPSNSQSRLVKDRKTNLDVTRKITKYLGNGQFGPTESLATDQFDQILVHTALDPYCGRLTLEQIGADEILLLGNQVREYFGSSDMAKFGYDFDDDQISYEEMFSIICNAVNCFPYVQSGVYNAFFDRPQAASTLQITHRNKVPDSESREDVFERKYDGVELTYRDNETGVNETIYVPTNRTATRPDRIEAPGVTTELQAYRRALREYNRQLYQVVNTEFQVDEFGRMIVPGQRIDSPDGTRFVRHAGNTDGYRVYDGDVVEVNGLVVELSEPVEFIDGEDHYIQFTEGDGENSELILCTPGDDEFTVVLSGTPAEPIYDGYSRDRTKFTFCSEQARESIALIPQTIEFKLDEGTETNTITAINYDSRYYQGDFDEL